MDALRTAAADHFTRRPYEKDHPVALFDCDISRRCLFTVITLRHDTAQEPTTIFVKEVPPADQGFAQRSHFAYDEYLAVKQSVSGLPP